MKKYALFAFIVCAIPSCGLFDIEKAESKKIVGNIFVVNLNLPEDSGFYAVFRKKLSSDREILRSSEYIDYLISDDSIMLIKTVKSPNSAYYLLHHIKGKEILSIQKILDFQFENYEKKINVKYSFFPKGKHGTLSNP